MNRYPKPCAFYPKKGVLSGLGFSEKGMENGKRLQGIFEDEQCDASHRCDSTVAGLIMTGTFHDSPTT